MAFTGTAGGRFQVRRLLDVQGDPGAAFIRISLPGTKPATAPDPTEADIIDAIGRGSVLGDIAVVTYATANATTGDFSCAFELTAIDATTMVRTWVLAAEFIDGNLVVAGSVFTNVGLGAGIATSALDNILAWDSPTDEIPELNPAQMFRGAYIGFVNNPDSTTATPTNPTQEILLVGDETDHLFWNGETLTLSGVTITDPTILVTTPPPGDLWDAAVAYTAGTIVSFNGVVYVAIVNNTGMQPDMFPAIWEQVVTSSPQVTISTVQPTTRSHGDLWYDTSIGRLFLFYADNPDMSLTVGIWADVTKN